MVFRKDKKGTLLLVLLPSKGYICSMFRILCFLLFTTVLIAPAIAQDTAVDNETEKDSILLLSSSNSIYSSKFSFRNVDFTSLDNLHHYRNYRTRFPVAHLGNNGLAFNYYDYQNPYYGIYGAAPAYSNYFFVKENINFYQTNKPLTNFGYMIGAEGESYLKLFHTQNFGKSLNIAATYHRLHSEGFYFRQLARQSLFNTSVNYTGRDSSYSAKAFFAYNSVEAFENGGLNVPDTADVSNTNADLLSIQLEKAESITRNHSYYLSHSLDLSSVFGIPKGIAALEHEFHYSKIFRRYKDQLDSPNSIYDHFYINQGSTYDSTYAREYYNSIGISLLSGLLTVQYKNLDARYFQNFIVQEDIQSEFAILRSQGLFGKFNYGIYVEKGLSGYSEKALNSRAYINYGLKNKDKLHFQLNYIKRRPDIFLQLYRANHLFYDTSFSQVISLQPSIEYQSRKWKTTLKIGLNQIDNYIYFDSSATSQQLQESLFNPYIRLGHKLNIGSKVVMENSVLYQQNDQEEYIVLPSLLSTNTLYYQNLFFKGSMLFQSGFEFKWIDDYTAIGYFPESNRIHLLQKGERLGDIKQLDFFVNAKIDDRFRLSIKIENLTGNNYNLNDFRIDDYPVPGKVYKIILSWALVN